MNTVFFINNKILFGQNACPQLDIELEVLVLLQIRFVLASPQLDYKIT